MRSELFHKKKGMGCRASRPQVRSAHYAVPQHMAVAFPHRGPQMCPPGGASGASAAVDTGYANPHEEDTIRASTDTHRVRRHRVASARELSPHASDDDLVLVCSECGAEIEHCFEGEYCPVSGMKHS